MIGIGMVLTCIVVISLSAPEEVAIEGEIKVVQEFQWTKVLAIGSASIVGLLFSLNSVEIHYSL